MAEPTLRSSKRSPGHEILYWAHCPAGHRDRELLAGCATSNNANTDVASWAGAFTCGVTDTLLAVMFPDMRFSAPGTTAALVAWPLAYTGPEGAAFTEAC